MGGEELRKFGKFIAQISINIFIFAKFAYISQFAEKPFKFIPKLAVFVHERFSIVFVQNGLDEVSKFGFGQLVVFDGFAVDFGKRF